MKIQFLGQGYNKDTHLPVGQYLINSLTSGKYTSFTGISAFASSSAVAILADYILNSKLESVNLIVGIDQEGTPKEALEEILKLNVNSYIFYQKESPIFHPKIYLFEGEIETRLIIGSSNLTTNGLFSNIESSILLEFDNSDSEGLVLLNDLKLHYKTLFDFTDINLFKISSEIIQAFVDKGIIPEKNRWTQKYNKTKEKAKESGETFEIPSREVTKLPREFKKLKKTKEVLLNEIIKDTNMDIDDSIDLKELNLVWTSKKLSRRDLNIPNGDNTNVTGSMFFSKGDTANIDQRHYFRDVVFKNLNWKHDTTPRTKHLERATASFRIVTLGEDHGVFKLSLTHNSDNTSPAYKQKNSMTSISWGVAKSYIAKESLLDHIAKLYSEPENNTEFTLIIE